MKASEFRPGNIFGDGNFLYKAINVHADGLVEGLTIGNDGNVYPDTLYPITNIEGVPLTEDWLIKFGFKAGGTYDNYKLNGIEFDSMFRTVDTNERSMFYLSGEIPTSMKINVTYVHQLQNIFHALTGQELTIG